MVFVTMCALTLLFQIFALPDALIRGLALSPSLAKSAYSATLAAPGVVQAAVADLFVVTIPQWLSGVVAFLSSSSAAAGAAVPKALVACVQTVGTGATALVPKKAAVRAWRAAKSALGLKVRE